MTGAQVVGVGFALGGEIGEPRDGALVVVRQCGDGVRRTTGSGAVPGHARRRYRSAAYAGWIRGASHIAPVQRPGQSGDPPLAWRHEFAPSSPTAPAAARPR